MTQSLAEFATGQLRAELARRQLTDVEAARRMGVEVTWLSRRKKGTRKITLEDLEVLATGLDLPAAFFMPEGHRVGATS